MALKMMMIRSRIIAAVLAAAVLILPTLFPGGSNFVLLLPKAEAATIDITTDTTWGDKTISKGTVVNVADGVTLTINGKVDLTNAEINVYGTIDVASSNGQLFVNPGGILNIHSGGTVNNHQHIRVDGLLEVNPGGILNIHSGSIRAVLDIYGTLNIDGNLINDALLYIKSGAVLRVNKPGIIHNDGTLTINSGGTLNINNGAKLENDGRINLYDGGTLKVFTGGTLQNDATIYKQCRGTLTLQPGASLSGSGPILGDQCIAITDVSLNEGNSGTTTFAFKVTRSGDTQAIVSDISVNWITVAGTATAGTDYVSRSGTLTFTYGQTTKTVNIAVKGDTTVEPNERFSVKLSNCSTACTFLDNSGRGTIKNDDG